MHEFSIASEIVQSVLDTTEKNKVKKVISIHLEIGELTLLNMEQVTFWMKELFKGTLAEGAKVKVRRIGAKIFCEECGYRGGGRWNQEDCLSHFALQNCPKCNSFQIKVEKGRECLLKRVQVVR